ncbi:unnamed protein product [Amoebophrya sp. A25]|nr:unnamed protein product [Amoebophrya sp. A25]|eukprot:GSA25T00015605001.1
MVRHTLDQGEGVVLFPNDDGNTVKRTTMVPLERRTEMLRLRCAALLQEHPQWRGRLRVVLQRQMKRLTNNSSTSQDAASVPTEVGSCAVAAAASTTLAEPIKTNWPGRLHWRAMLERQLSLELGRRVCVGFMLGEDSWRSSLLRGDGHKQSGIFALLKDPRLEQAQKENLRKLVLIFPRSIACAQLAEKASSRENVDRFWVGPNAAHMVEYAREYSDPAQNLSSTALRNLLGKGSQECDSKAADTDISIDAAHLHPVLVHYALQHKLYAGNHEMALTPRNREEQAETEVAGAFREQMRAHAVLEQERENGGNQVLNGVAQVREHYNATVAAAAAHQRAESQSVTSRNTHNFLKSVLILRALEHVRRRIPEEKKYLTLLDLGMGKGGDLAKYRNAGVCQVLGIDVSGASLREALRRLREDKTVARHGELRKMRDAGLEALFLEGNAFSASGAAAFLADSFDARKFGTARIATTGSRTLFHAVSSMFACHYAFSTEENARALVQTAAGRLCEGGVFFGVIPDAAAILQNCRDDSAGTARANSASCASWRTDFFTVEFTDPVSWRRAQALDHAGTQTAPSSASEAFGIEYTFSFVDAVEKLAEPLVHWGTFLRLARENDLELLQSAPLSELVPLERTEDGRFETPKSAGGDVERLARQYFYKGGLNPVVAELYRSFIFVKRTSSVDITPPILHEAVRAMAKTHIIHPEVGTL